MTSPPTLQLMVRGRIPVGIGKVAEVELLELLGVGGFGQVWKVLDPTSGHFYALKLIQNLRPGSVLAERARLEAEVAIPSEYIVPAIGLREWDNHTFLILFEYYEAQPLNQLLEEGRLTPNQKRKIFEHTLQGVAAAHRSNIIHRDLKPANILVNRDYDIRLIDFGISKFRGKGLTTTGDLIGTPQYMAPETLLEGAAIADARVDIFALGHILYELEMGQHFWKRRGWRQLEDFVRYLSQVPPPTEAIELGDFRDRCYPNARAVITKMLKIDPEERLASIEAVIRELGCGLEPLSPEHPKNLPQPSPLLIVESGSNRGACVVLEIADGGTLAIGRLDIAGNNESISRRHLEFSRSGSQYFVRDLGSKNGTLLRGIALAPGDDVVPIQPQDRIKVGDVFLRIEI